MSLQAATLPPRRSRRRRRHPSRRHHLRKLPASPTSRPMSMPPATCSPRRKGAGVTRWIQMSAMGTRPFARSRYHLTKMAGRGTRPAQRPRLDHLPPLAHLRLRRTRPPPQPPELHPLWATQLPPALLLPPARRRADLSFSPSACAKSPIALPARPRKKLPLAKPTPSSDLSPFPGVTWSAKSSPRSAGPPLYEENSAPPFFCAPCFGSPRSCFRA